MDEFASSIWQGDPQALETVRALENTIKRVTAEFQGNNAFNFSHELELAAYLMVYTREALSPVDVHETTICLARLEWPCIEGRSIDLVLWKPGIAKMARSKWGTPRGRLAKSLPLLAAIQVKRGGGNVASWYSTRKDIMDLEAVYASKYLERPLLYFLEWVDDSLTEHKRAQDTYRQVRSNLQRWCADAPSHRRALVVSRDKVGFAYPSGAWLVAPLPLGTLEII